MPIAQLFAVPRDADGLQRFAFVNMDHHRQMSLYLQRVKGIEIQQFVLYPLPPPIDMGRWFLNHQSWHAQIDAALGTEAFNLLSVDFQDYDAAAAWIFLHGTAHRNWQGKSGVA